MSKHPTKSPMASALDNPRILIAEGPWGIEEGPQFGVLGHGTVMGYDKVTHKCNWHSNWFLKTYYLSDWMMKKEDPVCPHCADGVPSMIQTLWTLKNMDKIQQEANYNQPLKWGHSAFYTEFYLQQATKVYKI